MKSKTILQEAPGKTMQKVFFCVFILLLGIGLARAADEEDAPKNSAYISLGEPMVLNLSGTKRLTFLQISADVLIADEGEERDLKLHVPAMRHSLIMLLSEQKAGDIKSPGKREEIRQQATARIKGLIADLHGEDEVTDVLFSSILVQ